MIKLIPFLVILFLANGCSPYRGNNKHSNTQKNVVSWLFDSFPAFFEGDSMLVIKKTIVNPHQNISWELILPKDSSMATAEIRYSIDSLIEQELDTTTLALLEMLANQGELINSFSKLYYTFEATYYYDPFVELFHTVGEYSHTKAVTKDGSTIEYDIIRGRLNQKKITYYLKYRPVKQEVFISTGDSLKLVSVSTYQYF